MRFFNNIVTSLVIFCSSVVAGQQDDLVTVQVTAQKNAALEIALCAPHGDKNFERMMEVVQHDLSFEQDFSFEWTHDRIPKTMSGMRALSNANKALVLQVEPVDKSRYAWRLYDTQQGTSVAKGSYVKRGASPVGWGHDLADILFKRLLDRQSSFGTRIAYCKEMSSKKKRNVRVICIADFDGSNEELLIKTPTLNIAPRWNRDVDNPLLFYSQATNKNLCLMVSDLHGRKRVTSNFDGLNMLPTFSRDGKHVVYCASRAAGSCQLFFYAKGVFKRLTFNGGNNISPVLSDDGRHLYFCSDHHNGRPAIYCHDFISKKSQKITKGTAAYSPTYSGKRGMLAYTQSIDGVMQVWTYDIATQKHIQITFNEGNKEECSWSPCGTYIVYSCEKAGKGRIALLNTFTGTQRYLTGKNENCSYPTWSPYYAAYPVLA